MGAILPVVLCAKERPNIIYKSYTPDDWRRYLNAYYRLVETVDAEIGRIRAEIERQNLWKNTVIIFTSDQLDGTHT